MIESNLYLLGTAWFLVFVFSTTLHEAAHAFAALRLGDSTAYRGGQVSLNPIPHIQREPFGMVLVPLLTFILNNGNWMIGWASAPYDPAWAQRYPKRSAVMALAGPAANLLLVIAAGLAVKIGVAVGYFTPPPVITAFDLVAGAESAGAAGVATVLNIVLLLNLVLFLFNLLPLPPMDGSAAIQLFMSDNVSRSYQAFINQPMWAFIGLIAAWRYFPILFGPFLNLLISVLYPGMYE